jgi:molybdopterin converting factor small subunit
LEIEIFGQLALNRESKVGLKLEKPATALEITKQLGLNPDAIGLITIDGRQSEFDDSVQDGDRICFFPYMSGG